MGFMDFIRGRRHASPRPAIEKPLSPMIDAIIKDVREASRIASIPDHELTTSSQPKALVKMSDGSKFVYSLLRAKRAIDVAAEQCSSLPARVAFASERIEKLGVPLGGVGTNALRKARHARDDLDHAKKALLRFSMDQVSLLDTDRPSDLNAVVGSALAAAVSHLSDAKRWVAAFESLEHQLEDIEAGLLSPSALSRF